MGPPPSGLQKTLLGNFANFNRSHFFTPFNRLFINLRIYGFLFSYLSRAIKHALKKKKLLEVLLLGSSTLCQLLFIITH